MPHESTVEHEKSKKEYGPIENAFRSNSLANDYSLNTPITEDHECDDWQDEYESGETKWASG